MSVFALKIFAYCISAESLNTVSLRFTIKVLKNLYKSPGPRNADTGIFNYLLNREAVHFLFTSSTNHGKISFQNSATVS